MTAAAAPPASISLAVYKRRWYTLGVLCLSLLVIVVDSTIVNVALPTFARDLHASTSGARSSWSTSRSWRWPWSPATG